MSINESFLFSANLHNLTELYRAMGASPINDYLYLCQQWPFRAWRQQDLHPHQDSATALPSELLAQLPAETKVPTFGRQPERERHLLAAGFTAASQQTAMMLAITEYTSPQQIDSSVTLRAATEAATRQAWVDTCSAAFGYTVDSDVINRVAQDSRSQIFLAELDGCAAATILTFTTEFQGKSVRGVHQLGVAPNFRRRGLARTLMQSCLAQAGIDNIDFVSLQASSLAKDLYLELGFQELFTISNYQR